MEKIQFEYFDGVILEGILITQTKVFCKAENGEEGKRGRITFEQSFRRF